MMMRAATATANLWHRNFQNQKYVKEYL